MIEYRTGDILGADVEALVNTVNCEGYMGKGLAKQFKKRFPANFKAYEGACEREEIRTGKMFVFKTDRLLNPRYIINFPTKRHWRGNSRMADIESGLVALVEVIQQHSIHSIAIPPLGCGLGGLDWKVIKARIAKAFSDNEDIHVIVYEPNKDLAAQSINISGREQ